MTEVENDLSSKLHAYFFKSQITFLDSSLSSAISYNTSKYMENWVLFYHLKKTSFVKLW